MTLSCEIAWFRVLLTKKGYAKQQAVAHDDLISQLPDEILVLIIERLPVRDLRLTSMLSKRWRNVYKLVSHIHISCPDLLLCHSVDDVRLHMDLSLPNRWRDILLSKPPMIRKTYLRCLQWKHANNGEHFSTTLALDAKLHDRLNSILGHWCDEYDNSPGIRSLRLNCCVYYIDRFQTVFYPHLQRMGVTTLHLCFSSCPNVHYNVFFPIEHLHLLPSSLKFLDLSWCTLSCRELGCQLLNHSLHTLQLYNVTVCEGSLICLLSTCVNLHSLSIINNCLCYSKKIVIGGNNLKLKSLTIHHWRGLLLQEVELHASNLIFLEFKNQRMVTFKFSHVPQLQTLHFEVQGNRNSMPCVLGQGNDLPNLKSLTLVASGQLQESSRVKMNVGFSKLRQLDLFVCCMRLSFLIPILQSCPLLEEFSLDLQNIINDEDWEAQLRRYYYSAALKEVKISGFCGKENEIEFAKSILSSAVNLQQMHLIWLPRYLERCCGRLTRPRNKWKVDDIQHKLQGRAISKNAQLIIY